MKQWTFIEKVQRIIAKLGGAYCFRIFWKFTKHKKSRARAIILNKEKSKILLVRNITYRAFHLPGGGLEKGEDAKKAVVREIKEELDIDISILYQLGKYKYQDTLKHVEIFVTEAQSETFSPEWELDAAEWFDIKKLPELRKSTKEVLRDFLAHNEPVFGTWGIDD